MKRYIKAYQQSAEEYDDLVDALLNNKPYDYERFHEYWETFHQPEEGAIKAQEVKVGDVIKNTEDASEINIGDEFRVVTIGRDEDAIGDYITFDFVFHVMMLSGDYEGTECDLHYMKDEYVGVLVPAVTASTKIDAASAIDHISVDSYTILRDVLIDILNDWNDEVFDNYPNVQEAVEDYIARVRDLCSMREYKKAHPAEVAEINALSDEDLIDISEKIWETT